MNLKAVLWDLDGTLIDSEPYWMRSELMLSEKYSIQWTAEIARECVGHPLSVTADRMRREGMPLPGEEIERLLLENMHAIIVDEGLPFRPGVKPLIEALADSGISQALVTMSYGPYAQAVQEMLPDAVFQVYRFGDSVARGKPDPEIYRAAMDDVGISPSEALGIEDSQAGVGALLAADVTPICVRGHSPVQPDQRLVCLEDLEGVTPTHLLDIHNEWQLRFGAL